MKYNSTDLYLSCIILSYGIPLIEICRETEKRVSFTFDISPNKAEEIIQKHWNRELILPTRNLIEAIQELKQRIHSKI